MGKLSDVEKKLGESVLIYGRPKVGKTLLAGRLAAHFDLLWFDLENGIETLRTQLPIEQQRRVDVITIPDTRTNPVAISTMMKVLTGNRVEICEEHGAASCPTCKSNKKEFSVVELNKLPRTTIVVVDSASQLSDSAAAKIANGSEAKFDWDDYDAWGKQLSLMYSAVQQCQ